MRSPFKKEQDQFQLEALNQIFDQLGNSEE